MEQMTILARLAGTPGPYRPAPAGGRLTLQPKLDLAGNPTGRKWVVEPERRRSGRERVGVPGMDRPG